MRFHDSIPVLIGVSAAIVQPQVAQALSSQAVSKIATQIAVLIESPNSPGSGVIIKKEGNTYTVLTCKHVVAKPGKYTIVTSSGARYSVNYKLVRQLKPGLDLATLQFTSNQNYTPAKLGNSDRATAGTIAYVSGFPIATSAVPRPVERFVEGKITANASQPLPDGYALVYSNSTIAGMSGSPVLNENGEVIGIHGRAETTVDAESRSISTGFNLGIPINTFVAVSSGKASNPRAAAAPTADDFYLQATNKYTKGDYKGAIASYNQALRINPNYVNAYYGRGVVRSELKDKKGAIEDYTQALYINPNYVDAYYNRGVVRSELGDYKSAIEDYTQALYINPNYVNAYYGRGNARSKLGDKKGAIEDYTQALRINPNYVNAYYGRGNARSKLGDKKGAIEDYNQAIRLNPKYADAYYNRGSARYYSGDRQGGIADYDQAIRLNPKLVIAYYNRGLTRVQSGDDRGAIADLTQVLRLNPKFANAYFVRSLARSQIGDKQGALADLQQAADLAQRQGNTSLYRTAQDEIERLRGTGKR